MASTAFFRRLVRQTVPVRFRQEFVAWRRRHRDLASGQVFATGCGGEEWPVRVQLSQPVMPSSVLQAKLSNLMRGAEHLNRRVIEPGQILSFWQHVGRPATQNGFAKGRNIVDGRLVLEVGGGLCQLSSLIYHLGLLAGLDVVERHPHSIDIYQEEDRFTPLGADATVVWGYKDLRLRNPRSEAISLCCFVDGHRLYGEIRSRDVIVPGAVEFVRNRIGPNLVDVHTMSDGEELCVTRYPQRAGLQEV